MDQDHVYKPSGGTGVQLEITPENAGWTYLSFATVVLGAGEQHSAHLADQETAIVPLEGAGTIHAGVRPTRSRTSSPRCPGSLRPARHRHRGHDRRLVRVRHRQREAEACFRNGCSRLRIRRMRGGERRIARSAMLAPPIPAERLIPASLRTAWNLVGLGALPWLRGSPYLGDLLLPSRPGQERLRLAPQLAHR